MAPQEQLHRPSDAGGYCFPVFVKRIYPSPCPINTSTANTEGDYDSGKYWEHEEQVAVSLLSPSRGTKSNDFDRLWLVSRCPVLSPRKWQRRVNSLPNTSAQKVFWSEKNIRT